MVLSPCYMRRESMAVLQVYQAKLLQSMDVSGLDPTAFKELRSMTDLALCTTKATVQAIDRSMSSLVMLEHHLWLTLMEIKDADKVPFLASPVSPTGLFGSTVEESAEFCFQSIRDPGPKIALDACLRHSPDLRDRKRRGLNLAAARLPPRKSLLCLQAPRSVPGADSSVFVINSVVNTGPVQKAATQPAACNFNGHFTPSLLINIM